MYLHKNINSRGYATLLLVTIIGFSFLVCIAVVSREMRQAQDRNLAAALRLEATAVANACQNEVLVRLLNSANYSGEETIDIDGHQCRVGGITIDPVSDLVSFQVTTEVGDYVLAEEVRRKTF